MTDEQIAMEAVDKVAVDVKKDAENEVHPLVKTLWQEFIADKNAFGAWIKKEISKL